MRFVLEANDAGMLAVSFEFEGKESQVVIQMAGGDQRFDLGSGVWRKRHVDSDRPCAEQTSERFGGTVVAVGGAEKSVGRVLGETILNFIERESSGFLAMAGDAGAAIASEGFIFEEKLSISFRP